MPRPRPRLVSLACALTALAITSAVAQAAIWPSATRRAERELASSDASVRLATVATLADLPRASARRLLLRALDDPDSQVASSALELLLRLETPGVTQRVVPWLSGSDKRLRHAAALALAVAPAPGATSALARTLSDSDPEVRAAAAAALGASQSAEAVLPLLGHLDDSVPEVREAVATALGALGDARAVMPLIGKIEDSRPGVRAAVARALGSLHDSRSSHALLLALRDADSDVVVVVVRALGILGESAAVSPLATLLKAPQAPEPETRRAILIALGRIASTEAGEVLIRELAFDEPGREREPVLAALGSAPAAFTPSLRACLDGALEPALADGCALGLARVGDTASHARVRQALDRGRISARVGLLVLGSLGDSRALTAALERLTVPDAETRSAAMDAAAALLSPTRADGRAVEPLARALSARGTSREERLRLVELLGRTGSERALRTLIPLLVSSTDPALSEVAATALGNIPGRAAGAALLPQLDAEEPRVRRAAALAIRSSSDPELLRPLLDRFEHAGKSERALLSLAIFGPLSHNRDPRQLRRATSLLASSYGAEREPLLEALSASQSPLVQRELLSLVQSHDVGDRAKLAELLAGWPEPAALERLLRDPQPRVRQNAAWSLGFADAGQLPAARSALVRALKDESAAVVGNAAVSLGRLLRREPKAAAALLCDGLLADARASVREQALRGLLLARARCQSGTAARLLSSDPRARVRRAAAELLLASQPGPQERALLLRCQEGDPDATVADTCAGTGRPQAGPAAPVTILILPSTESEPTPLAPFALLLADGGLRLGAADRRGAVHEPRAPEGRIELLPFTGGY